MHCSLKQFFFYPMIYEVVELITIKLNTQENPTHLFYLLKTTVIKWQKHIGRRDEQVKVQCVLSLN